MYCNYRRPIFIAICLLSFLYSTIFSQNLDQVVTLELENFPLASALNEIGEQAGVYFIYGSEAVDSVRVSCDVKKWP